MSKLKELQEKRRKGAESIRELGKKFDQKTSQWASAEDRAAYEKANKDYDENKRELEAEVAREQASADFTKRLTDLDEDDKRSVNHGSTIPGLEDSRDRKQVGTDGQEITEEDRGLALAGFIIGPGDERFGERHAKAMKKVGLRTHQKCLTIRMASTQQMRSFQREFRAGHHTTAIDRCRDSRALSAFNFGTGGATVGSSLVRNLEINMLAYGGMRQEAETISTASGEDMPWPTADDTSNEGEQLGESGSIGSSVDPAFGVVRWGAYKFSSKPILVPYEFIEDSFIDTPGVIGDLLGERLGRITNRKYTDGPGSSGPFGILNAAGVGVSANSATAIAPDEVFKLVHSVDPAYRAGAAFMFNDAILLYLRLLKDLQNRYLWQDGMQAGRPDTLLGYRHVNNQHMPSTVTTGKKTMLFGQFSRYKIRRVNRVRLYRLEERYRDNDQDGFIAFIREDGNLLNAGTNPVKYLQQA